MKTEIVCVIDRSGSMAPLTKDSIGGFNSFLESQKEIPGEATLTLALFDHEYSVVHDNVNLQEVPNLNSDTYVPRGMTALHDAIGRTMDTVGVRLSNTPEQDRPEKVIFVILTDGAENSSQEYQQDKIAEMIKHQREVYNWEFVFLAANQDAFETGGSLNISRGMTMNYSATSKGVTDAYCSASASVADLRN